MKKKYLVLLLVTFACSMIFAQIIEGEKNVKNDVIKLNYEKKSAKSAMLLSTVFPGAGQFYTNRRSVTGYIFATLEVGFWAGLIYYNIQGDDKEDEYMEYADGHYSRNRQNEVASNISNVNPNDKYDDAHFHLDTENTQHFYEDIGKYNKYSFGWDDWYGKYFENGVQWAWDGDGAGDVDHTWIGNYPTDPAFAGQTDYDAPEDGSIHRSEYNKMRADAEDFYDTSRLFSWGLVANHIFSAIDAIRVTRNYNSEYLSVNENKPQILFSAVNFDNQITPMLTISKKF